MENVNGLVTFPPNGSGNGTCSRRMGGILHPPSFPPPRLVDQKPITPPASPKDEAPSMSSPSRTSPFIPPPQPPPRSPLRPSPKSVSSFTTLVDLYTRRDTMATLRTDNLDAIANRKKSIASFSALLDQYSLNTPIMPSTPATDVLISENFIFADEKPLPIPPDDDSPLSSPTATLGLTSVASEASTEITLAPSAPVITKREHALKELLSSERAYASDLAFIRNAHIPMALGKQAPFHLPRPATPPSSSGSSSRTLSTTSSESSSSSNSYGPPMTRDDVRVIFGNIAELAVFSDMLSERLQEALGDVLEDGKGEDWVGALFLEIIPQMEPLYMHYITKHPIALKHLNSLPRTPALARYLAQTQNLASSVTHAWDLPSLLIKPVQRLLKYSLLLTTIIEQTSDDHGDKENLRNARDRMEQVARAVNEGRRRMEVVKEILAGKGEPVRPALQKKLSITKNTQGGVARMKSIGMGLRAPRPKEENNEESARVAELEKQLKKCEGFVREFAKDIASWSQTVRASQNYLRVWAENFGQTIGISDEQPSEAFTAFVDVIDTRLLPLCDQLDVLISKELLPELAGLLDTSRLPLRLLAAMHSLEPLHNALLNLNYSKHRPTPSLHEASQKYLALRGQLAADLPKYLVLLDKGIVMCIHQFARGQTDFWGTVRDQWSALWDCLRMEGETNAGCEETLTLWWARYSEAEEMMSKLSILKRDKPYVKPSRPRASTSSSDPYCTDPSLPHMTPLPNSPSSSFSGSLSTRHRSFGSLDSITPRNLRASPSTESVPTLSTPHRAKSRPRTPDSGLGRLKTRANTAPLASSSASQYSLNMYTAHPHSAVREYAESVDSRMDVRGRKSRSSSLSRRLSETLRAPIRRSPSQKSVTSQRSQRGVIPNLNATSSGFHGAFPAAKYAGLPYDFNLDFDISNPPASPASYYVTAIHTCTPPEGAMYMELPFFTLNEGDMFGVLSELGHPSLFEGLCMDIDEGEEDCLLVVKNEDGEVGLALASFLEPISYARTE